MTRRERLERKLEKRAEWASKAEARSDALYHSNDRYRGDVAFNTQPGHIPERARAIRRTEKAFELSNLARHHESKADGLERQLDRSIFSDDENAIAALEARIAEREAARDQMKRVNALYRKGDAAGLAALGLNLETLRARLADAYAWEKTPYPSWQLTNLGANIRRDRERIEEIKKRAERTAAAEASGGVTVEGGDWVRVTFAEKPAREVLEALKAAGFRWGGGSWCGERAKLPAGIVACSP